MINRRIRKAQQTDHYQFISKMNIGGCHQTDSCEQGLFFSEILMRGKDIFPEGEQNE
jgi:hypothetical protein